MIIQIDNNIFIESRSIDSILTNRKVIKDNGREVNCISVRMITRNYYYVSGKWIKHFINSLCFTAAKPGIKRLREKYIK